VERVFRLLPVEATASAAAKSDAVKAPRVKKAA
jgi:hypothetical protein